MHLAPVLLQASVPAIRNFAMESLKRDSLPQAWNQLVVRHGDCLPTGSPKGRPDSYVPRGNSFTSSGVLKLACES